MSEPITPHGEVRTAPGWGLNVVVYPGAIIEAHVIWGFLYAAFLLIAKIIADFPVESWASFMVVLLLVSGTQLVMLGTLGEYVWRNLDEARRRLVFPLGEAIGIKSL